MKTTFRLVFFIFFATVITACGGGSESVKPASNEVGGQFEGCFKVVDRSYKFKKKDDKCSLNIELTRTSESLPFSTEKDNICSYGRSYEDTYGVGFGIELIDKDGDIVYKTQPTSGWSIENGYVNDDAPVELIKLASGQTGSIAFELPADDVKNAISFRIYSIYKAPTVEQRTSSYSYSAVSSSSTAERNINNDDISDNDDDVSFSTTSSSSSDWDDVIDSYERYVDKYISVLKRVANNDASAMSEYPSLLAEAQSLANKLDTAQDDMSVEQWTRYMKVNQKMAAAISSMQK